VKEPNSNDLLELAAKLKLKKEMEMKND